MGKYFGTDGFRGEANVNLTADHAYKVGRFLGYHFNKIKKAAGDKSPARVVIGKDTRRSSYMLEYALVGGLVASGADAYMLHVTTTPCVAYITRVDKFDCGIMISASHNPYYDNGIKLINSRGEKMDEDVTALIEAYLDEDKDELPFALRNEIGKTVDYISGRNRYIGYLISLGIYSFRGKKVGLDCANGSAWSIAKAVFDALGAEIFVINDKPDGLNINLASGSTHPEKLQSLVKENGLDVGFAYDGDADRCICVDEKGNIVDGDAVLYICAKHLKQKGELTPDTVVTTVMSNYGLYKAFDKLGIDYAVTNVGDRFVYEYMVKNGCRLGGEQSGHIIFSGCATTGDGIITSLKVMEVLMAEKTSLSKLTEKFEAYPQTLINVAVSDKAAAMQSENVEAAIDEAQKALGDNGRILVRASGTELLIRVMVEAREEALCRSLAKGVADVIAATDGNVV